MGDRGNKQRERDRMMQRIIFATGNAGKMKEIREILSDLPYEVVSMKEAGVTADIVEDGTTFEENAMIKAKTIAELNQIITALTLQKYDNPMMVFRSVSRVRVHGDATMSWTLDGEYQPGASEILIENLPQRVQILLPKRD